MGSQSQASLGHPPAAANCELTAVNPHFGHFVTSSIFYTFICSRHSVLFALMSLVLRSVLVSWPLSFCEELFRFFPRKNRVATAPIPTAPATPAATIPAVRRFFRVASFWTPASLLFFCWTFLMAMKSPDEVDCLDFFSCYASFNLCFDEPLKETLLSAFSPLLERPNFSL